MTNKGRRDETMFALSSVTPKEIEWFWKGRLTEAVPLQRVRPGCERTGGFNLLCFRKRGVLANTEPETDICGGLGNLRPVWDRTGRFGISTPDL
jgi:hypothetical protein